MSDVKLITMNDNLSFYYWSYKIPCWIQGTVIDIETTGIKPEHSELVGLGLIKENRISCFIRSLTTSDEHFRMWSKDKVQRTPKPYIAYYNEFERNWLRLDNDNRTNWIEIQPKSRHKKLYAVNIQHLMHSEDGSVVPDAWRNKDIKTVLWHLACDMFEELALYVSASHEYRRMRDPLRGIFDFEPEEFNNVEFLEKQILSAQMINETNIEEFKIEWDRKDKEIKQLHKEIDKLNQLLKTKQ